MPRSRCLLPFAAALLTCAPAHGQEADGRQTFETVCAVCHSVQPPPLKAPPMSHVAGHYLAADSTPQLAAARIAAWIRAPAKERSLMPAMAIERWGLMPPLLLPDSQAAAVASYVLTLAGGHGGMGRAGGMMGRGRGPRGRQPPGPATGTRAPGS